MAVQAGSPIDPMKHLVVGRWAWYEEGGGLAWEGLSHLGTSEVGEVLERLVRRITALASDDPDPDVRALAAKLLEPSAVHVSGGHPGEAIPFEDKRAIQDA